MHEEQAPTKSSGVKERSPICILANAFNNIERTVANFDFRTLWSAGIYPRFVLSKAGSVPIPKLERENEATRRA